MKFKIYGEEGEGITLKIIQSYGKIRLIAIDKRGIEYSIVEVDNAGVVKQFRNNLRSLEWN